VPDLDKERPYLILLVRPLPIPHLHDWRKMDECLINFNKGEDDEGCLKFCNILKWSATLLGKLLKGCLEITLLYDSITMKVQ
jgi:hypothetical protein